MKPSLPASNQEWVEYIGTLKLPFPVRHKFMFGGVLFYCDGKPAACVTGDGLGVKIRKPLRQAFMENSRPLKFDFTPSKSYVRVPDEVVVQKERLQEWFLETQ